MSNVFAGSSPHGLVCNSRTSKLSFLAEVLRKRLDFGRQESACYLHRLEHDDEGGDGETAELARELTVGETYFYRNHDQFRAFAEVVLPARMQARRPQKCLRVLSAGCASGEEAYTLAIILRDAIPDRSWDVSIRAVDVNPAALERAAAARFSAWALRETPPAVRDRWFRPAGRDLVLDDDIRSAVTFERRNLTADDFGSLAAGLLRCGVLPQRDHVLLAREDVCGDRADCRLACSRRVFLSRARRDAARPVAGLPPPPHARDVLLPAPQPGRGSLDAGGIPESQSVACGLGKRKSRRSSLRPPGSTRSARPPNASARSALPRRRSFPRLLPLRRSGTWRVCSTSCSSKGSPRRLILFAPCRRRRARIPTSCS